MNDYEKRSYGDKPIGMNGRVGIVVIDFQVAYTDTQYLMGGTPLVMRAVENTARLLAVARAHNVPVASCYTAYHSSRDMPHWKISVVREQFIEGHPCTKLEPRIYDKEYDVLVRKHGPSIFFQTEVVPYFTKEGVETVVITGCNTSGCIRASTIDSFQHGFRTMVPEDCVGDFEEGPHRSNLQDVGLRYADIVTADAVIDYIRTNANLLTEPPRK